MSTAQESLQDLYQNSKEKVRKIKLSEVEAEKQYLGYVNFVRNFAPKNSKLLDIGCGSGWSTFFLSKNNIECVGMDLHKDGYEPNQREFLKFIQGSVLEIPFEDKHFDVTTTNECLEHVPDPEKALDEMVRVTKRGGHIIIVGPNLLSLGHSARALFKYVWQHKPISRIIYRDKDLPYHPLGNTLPEVLYYLTRNSILLPVKYLSTKPFFNMRRPDLRPPFHADSDSCYFLNPVDLQKYFSDKKKFKIIQSGALGRHKILEPIAAGTWFCAQKLV